MGLLPNLAARKLAWSPAGVGAVLLSVAFYFESPPLSGAEHFWKCKSWSGWFDRRDPGAAFDHDGPLQHRIDQHRENPFSQLDSQIRKAKRDETTGPSDDFCLTGLPTGLIGSTL
jgi:hypothetical protein